MPPDDSSADVRAARAREFAVGIVRTLRDAGHTAYFAGGCVRDELLGLHPKDYDVATDATPARVAELYPRAVLVGAHFGVVLIRAPGRAGDAQPIVTEVATFRADGPYSDRRRPDRVTFSDPQTDARRRDFTVNALFLDPLADRQTQRHADVLGPDESIHGQVVDYVDGLADLDARILRAVGDPEARLAEDHLRALRAVRLAARLGFQIDPGTADAICRHARDLQGVSTERVGEEMRKILAHPSRAEGMRLLQSLGLDGPVLGRTAAGAELSRLAGLPPDSGISESLAALALDRGDVRRQADVARVLTDWRRSMCLSNEEREQTRDVLQSYLVLRHEFMRLGVAPQKRAVAAGGFRGGLAVLAAEDGAAAEDVERRVTELAATPSGLWPVPLVTGDDLVAAGYEPGPRFAGVLARVYDAQLEDSFANREDAMRLAARLWSEG